MTVSHTPEDLWTLLRALAHGRRWWWTFHDEPHGCGLCLTTIEPGDVYAFEGNSKVSLCASCADLELELCPTPSRRLVKRDDEEEGE